MVKVRRARAGPEESAALRVALYVASVIAMAAMGIFGHSGLASGCCIAVTTIGHRWSWRHRHGPRRVVQAAAGLAMIGATLFLLAELFVIGSGPDPFPQGTFLLLLMASTSFDVRSRPNCYSSLVLAFLGLYAASSVAYDDTMAVAVVLFGAAVLAVLLAATHADARRRGTLHAPEVWAAPARLPSPSRAGAILAGITVAVGLGGLLAYGLLPPYAGALPVYPTSADLVAAPTFTGEVVNPLLSVVSTRPHDVPRSAYYGFAPELVLGRYGPLDSTVLMRVRSTGWSYWRMQTYDSYSGRSWQAAAAYANEIDRGADGSLEPTIYPVEDHPASDSGPTIRQTFTLLRGGPNLVAVADRPLRLYFPADRVWQRLDAGDLLADQPLPTGTTYSVISRLPPSDPAILRAAHGTDPQQVSAEDRALPLLSAAVRRAAAVAVVGAATRYDRVLALISYLQAHARYDLNAPSLAHGQEGVAALLASGRGYCEQFATALAVLARADGIPARLVTGFAPGDYDPLARVFTVRASDAHAWTEIYFPGLGWIPFDATPSFGAQPRAHSVSGWLLGDVVGPNLPRPNWRALLHGTVSAAGAGTAEMSMAGSAVLRTFQGGGLLPIGAAAALALLFVLTRAMPRRAPALPRDRAAAVLRTYLAGERLLLRHGYAARPAPLTPRRYAQSVPHPRVRAALLALAELAMRAAYGPGEVSAEDVAAANALRQELRHLTARRSLEAHDG